ncbi:hypothetical protein M501DRAFT_998506 [Patellaria atrata CBS 101060]|uniref:Large ribosomal subunit protein uL23m n=1 Tax=Patellaria atrata CBS 101060 TaxID=1346257 RepID=A0A9P4SGH1_9PEZI|nr:hypothetical protein M501DRAFT_998506 [Patellaria atrata CBS 101060]
MVRPWRVCTTSNRTLSLSFKDILQKFLDISQAPIHTPNAHQMASKSLNPHFIVGRKQVFLPNHIITLLRSPRLPPTFARFIVPLTFNKLDLRDYLWHAYGVRALRVRSYVHQQKVRADKRFARLPKPRKWHRPRAVKRMTIEMDSPFVWPAEPEDYELWDKSKYDATKHAHEDMQNKTRPLRYAAKRPEERESIAVQAKRLLEGRDKWKEESTT